MAAKRTPKVDGETTHRDRDRAPRTKRMPMAFQTRRQRYLIELRAAKAGVNLSTYVRIMSLEAADWEPPEPVKYPEEPGATTVRYTPAEYAAINRNAKADGVPSVSGWVRAAAAKRAGWNPEADSEHMDRARKPRRPKPA